MRKLLFGLFLLFGCGPEQFMSMVFGLETDRPIILPIYGQSLANGGQGYGPINTTDLYGNQRYIPGTGLVPLVENCNGEGVCPSATNKVESPASGIANQFAFVTGRSVTVVNGAVSGKCYSDLKRGTTYYNNFLSAISGAQTALGEPAFVQTVVLLLGNCDTNANLEFDYVANQATLAANLDEDIRAITLQTTPVTTTVMQMNSPTAYNKEHEIVADFAQLKGALDSSGLIDIAGAQSYQRTNADAQHMVAAGYLSMGIEIGDHIARRWLGQAVSAIYPIASTISGNEYEITFTGVRGALAFDTSGWINETGLDNHGFKMYDAGGVTTTTITLPCSDKVRLVGSGSWPTIARSGYTFDCNNSSACAGNYHGRTTGIRGDLYDDEPIIAYNNDEVYRYAAVFGPGQVIPTGGVSTTVHENPYWLKVDSTDGSQDYLVRVDGSDTRAATNKFTACVNAKLDQLAFPGEGLIAKSARGAFSWAFYAGYGTTTGRRLFFTMSSNATQAGQAPVNYVATYQLVVQTGVEQQYCVVYNAGSVTIYVNGSSSALDPAASGGTIPTSIYQTTGGMTIAKFRSGNGTDYMIPKGYVDMPVYTPTNWSSTEVSNYYNSGSFRTPVGINATDPTVWLPLGEKHKWAGRETGTQDMWSGTKWIRQDGVRNAMPTYENNYWTVNGNPVMVRR